MRSRDDHPGPLRSTVRSALVFAAVGLGLLAIFVGGEYIQRLVAYRTERATFSGSELTDGVPPVQRLSVTDPIRDMIRNTWHRLPHPEDEARLAASGLPVYELRMSPKNRALHRRTAEQVTARSISVGITRDYVPAEFLLDGEWIGVDVKLRGLTDLHHMPGRPSLRIKFPKHRLLRGMRQINVSDPYDKGMTADLVTAMEFYAASLWSVDRTGLLSISVPKVRIGKEREQGEEGL